MLEILEDEMISAMALVGPPGLPGPPGLAHLTPTSVCRAEPVTTAHEAHEMSAWVTLPVGRILQP
jgi:hypothetical protein